MTAIIVSKKQLKLAALALTIAILAFACWRLYPGVNGEATAAGAAGSRVFEMVTGEFRSETADGKEIEVYQWSPGSITVARGEQVTLRITGVSGASHPFVIQGLNVRGEVKKGAVTEVSFTPEKEGTYPIVCLTHTDLKHGGPMVGYITVQ
jgi:heme/copper-type cytochrome/quinol oxidase subunit 2